MLKDSTLQTKHPKHQFLPPSLLKVSARASRSSWEPIGSSRKVPTRAAARILTSKSSGDKKQSNKSMAPLSCGAFNNQTKGCWLEEKESSTLWIDLEHFPIVFSKNIAAGNSQEMTEQWNTDFDNSFENVTSWHWPPPTNAMAILHSPSLWDICFSTRLRTMSPVPVNICHLNVLWILNKLKVFVAFFVPSGSCSSHGCNWFPLERKRLLCERTYGPIWLNQLYFLSPPHGTMS